jgi:hypothetical protein
VEGEGEGESTSFSLYHHVYCTTQQSKDETLNK